MEIAQQGYDPSRAMQVATDLPEGPGRDMFVLACSELAGKLRDTDIEALRIGAWALHRHSQAQETVEEIDRLIVVQKDPVMRAMLRGERRKQLKDSRDEAALYLKIADQYALTFLSRLRAGVLKLTGQNLMASLHSSMADAIASALIGETDVVDAVVAETAKKATSKKPAAAAKPKKTRAKCKTCGKSFSYVRRGRARVYCDGCRR